MVIYEIVIGVVGMDNAIFYPDNPIAVAESPQVVSSKNPAFLFQETNNGLMEDMASDMDINGAEWVI